MSPRLKMGLRERVAQQFDAGHSAACPENNA